MKSVHSGKDTKANPVGLALRPCYSGWARFLSFPIQLELLKQEVTRRFSAGYFFTHPAWTTINDQYHSRLMFDSEIISNAIHMDKFLICNTLQ